MTIDDSHIAVVVPARNEARHIAAVVRSMPAFVDRIVLVDDGSSDDTVAVARAAAGSVPLEVRQHATSRGVGAAIVTGYRHVALDQASDAAREVIAVMAGDAQMDADDLCDVVSPVACGAADYVKGNRLRHPDVLRAMPWTRLLGTLVLGRLTALATGTPLGDSQCGYTAISGAAVRALAKGGQLAALWPRYGYPNDLLGVLAADGFRIREATVRPVYRDEDSGLRAWHVATISWLIARAAYRRRVAAASR